jgi:hypothetical protein
MLGDARSDNLSSNTRVESNPSSDAEYDSGKRPRKLNLAIMPGSDPPTTQKVEVAKDGKSATITFAVKVENDAVKNNSFTITVYGQYKKTFGPRGKINSDASLKSTLKIKLELPKPKSFRDKI